MKPALLVTSRGEVFRGQSIGIDGVAVGEAVFNTAMTGYQEIVTDPSYSGQVVVLTTPHIGNYGATPSDEQSNSVHARALVTRSMSRMSSSWRSEGLFTDYLLSRNVVAMTDVDTRRLTRHIRSEGAMPIAVGTDIEESELMDIAASAPSMVGQNLVRDVTTPDTYHRSATTTRVGHVVAYDFGIKRDIVVAMNARGLDVSVIPSSTDSSSVLATGADAVFLSNGPGDPEPLTSEVAAVRELLGSIPIFGICLGHQVLALALGASTYKLPFGHHGGNHPVRNLSTGTVDITSQNHGFAVDLWSITGEERPTAEGLPSPSLLPLNVPTPFGDVSATHQNLNDGTNEGLECRDASAFSVQYHPEAAPGPREASRLFDRFVGVVEAARA